MSLNSGTEKSIDFSSDFLSLLDPSLPLLKVVSMASRIFRLGIRRAYFIYITERVLFAVVIFRLGIVVEIVEIHDQPDSIL